MVRDHEVTSTSQTKCKRGTPWEMATISSLVTAMSIEELRSFNEVPANIRLEEENSPVAPTIVGVDNAIYFTHEQFVAGLRFPIPSLVKKFLHFTRASLVLIHSNVFRILMGCDEYIKYSLQPYVLLSF